MKSPKLHGSLGGRSLDPKCSRKYCKFMFLCIKLQQFSSLKYHTHLSSDLICWSEVQVQLFAGHSILFRVLQGDKVLLSSSFFNPFESGSHVSQIGLELSM